MNKVNFLLLAAFYIIFSLFTESQSIERSSDEPPGYIEENGNGYSVFKRIRELEDEKVLDVKSNIRSRDNFYRVRNQVIRLKNESNSLKETHQKLDEMNPILESCILKHLKEEEGTSRVGGNHKGKIDYSIDYTSISQECLCPFKKELSKLPKELHVIPENKEAGTFGEKAGTYEYNIGLSATHTLITHLDREGVLDVKKGIRVKDNLNRCRRQVIEQKNDINRQIINFNKTKELSNCLDVTFSELFAKTKAPTEMQGALLGCFTEYKSHRNLFENKEKE